MRNGIYNRGGNYSSSVWAITITAATLMAQWLPVHAVQADYRMAVYTTQTTPSPKIKVHTHTLSPHAATTAAAAAVLAWGCSVV